MITDEQIDKAISRLALTEDGRMLHLRLQRVLLSLAPGADAGALQRHEGRRTLAHDLKRLMDEALAETASEHNGPGRESAIVIAPRRPAESGGRRGTERRVGPYADTPRGSG